jgi:hypothetical protein
MAMAEPLRLTTSTLLDGLAAAQGQCFVNDGLQGQLLATANLVVGGDDGTLAPVSLIRSRRLCAEKPPNTTEWVAPIRAQACMAATPSIDMEM